MSLQTLLQKIENLSPDQLKTTEGDQLAQEGIDYPNDSKNGTVRVFPPSQANKDRGVDIEMRGNFKINPSILLSFLLQKARAISFHPGTFAAEARVTWTEATLSQENTLGDIDEIDMSSSYGIQDPRKSRIHFNSYVYSLACTRNTYALNVRIREGKMTVYATGDYIQLLPRIIQEIAPQTASLSLSKADMRRLINNSSWFVKWWIVLSVRMENARQKKRDKMFFQLEKEGARSSEEKPIELKVPVTALPEFSRAIGRSLFNRVGDDMTCITSLHKNFNSPNKILDALKKITMIVKSLDSNEKFGIPLISSLEAKKFLDEEITKVVDSYKVRDGEIISGYFGSNTHVMRGQLLKRLAVEHFGASIVEHFDAMEVSQYLAYLEGLGYIPRKQEEMKYLPPDYQVKERHLLQFFCQSYTNDPHVSIEKFRMWCTNTPPNLTIKGNMRIDACNMGKIVFPQRASLAGLIFSEVYEKGSSALSVIMEGNKATYFYARMSQIPPTHNIHNLQTIACDQLGIKFL